MIDTVAVHDIPRYSTTCNLYSYTKAIVSNNVLQNRHYSDKEVTHIFLSHLDSPTYTSAIKECKAALLLSTTVDPIYLVPIITGTIYQLAPTHLPTNHNREREPSGHVQLIDKYINDEYIAVD